MGYCIVGIVSKVGDGVSGFTVGERVASNGKHADVVNVPVNLCAKVRDGLPDEDGDKFGDDKLVIPINCEFVMDYKMLQDNIAGFTGQ
jgi:hypothetical protein